MDVPSNKVKRLKKFPLLLSEELLFRATLYYCGKEKEKENFIHSFI